MSPKLLLTCLTAGLLFIACSDDEGSGSSDAATEIVADAAVPADADAPAEDAAATTDAAADETDADAPAEDAGEEADTETPAEDAGAATDATD